MSAHAWPVRLTFSRSKAALNIVYDDGNTYDLPYETLRLESPSADVRGHGNGPKPPPPVIAPGLSVEKADPVGRYAVQLYFSDGHSSGLYTWAYLRALGEAQAS